MIDDPDNEWQDAEFTDADRALKTRVGSGGIPELLLQKAQESIDDNHSNDFKPYAEEYLKNISASLKALKDAEENAQRFVALQNISSNIMHLKANGGMFGYNLISMISNVALNFADTERKINKDFYKIIEAHNNSVQIILQSNLKGTGGKAGEKLVFELRDAVQRFQKKYHSDT